MEVKRLNIEGMNCANCAKGIEKHLQKKGYNGVTVNFSTNEVSFSFTNEKFYQNITKSIEDLGYKIIEKKDEIFFRYLPTKKDKKSFSKKTVKESPFGILKDLNLN